MQTICMEQMLYGYRDGHTLLASSLKERLREQSVTDVLSDAAGRGIFDEYLTGFPLVKDGYYAFAKTWYADEMPRPGCVWTHILLVPLTQTINFGGRIKSLFRRPNPQTDYRKYKESLILSNETLRTSTGAPVLNDPYYEYVVYTLFSSDKKIYICDEDGGKYEEALLDILFKLPTEYKAQLTICTGVKTNRYFAKDIFSYQVAEEIIAKRISRDAEDAVVYKGACIDEKYPLWTRYLSQKCQEKGQAADVFDLAQKYGVKARAPIKELSKVLYSIAGDCGRWDLEEYLLLLGKIDDGIAYAERTIKEVFCVEESAFDDMFEKKSIVNFLLSNVRKNNCVFTGEKHINGRKAHQYALQLYQSGNAEKMRDLIHSYIHQELSSDGLVLVDEIIALLKPEDLARIMGLKRSACNVLIRRKPQLAACADLWRQDRDFQLEMLQSICTESLIPQEVTKIAVSIVANSKEQVADYADSVLGCPIRQTVYDGIKAYLSSETRRSGMREGNPDYLKAWLPVLVRDGNLYVELLKLPLDWPMTKVLISCINSYRITSSEEAAAWTKLLQVHFSRLKAADSYHNAVFFFPLVLRMNDETQIRTWVFTELNEKLERNEMCFDDWIRVEPLLPPVSIEQSWDKCLRLRLAFGIN